MGGFFSITSWNDVDVDTASVAPTAPPAGNNKPKPNTPANKPANGANGAKSNKSNMSSDPKPPGPSNNKAKKGRVARQTYKKRRG